MESKTSAPSPSPTLERVVCTAPSSFVFAHPCGAVVSQLLRGEAFEPAAEEHGWLGGTCSHDGYRGFVQAPDFIRQTREPEYVVTAVTALVFAEPAIKSGLIGRLPLGARLVGQDHDETFLALERGFVHRRHAGLHARLCGDPVAWAERLVGAPYLWGGRGSNGIDCSGLVQLSLGMTGVSAPRDSGPQRALGSGIDRSTLQRGDLVFLPGHVAMMVDGEHVIHANAYWMAVVIEPLAAMLGRLPPSTPVEARRL